MHSFFRAFTEHFASVNETYLLHLASAWSFAFHLLAAGAACFVHGLLPALFMRTGSSTVMSLYDR